MDRSENGEIRYTFHDCSEKRKQAPLKIIVNKIYLKAVLFYDVNDTILSFIIYHTIFFSFYFETCKLDTSELYYLDTTSTMLYKLLYVVYAEFVFIGF